MQLTLIKSGCLDDWYTIEKAVHEHKSGLIPCDGGFSFWDSGRISDACVEGIAEEMLCIADAIIKKGRVLFKRCAVDATGEVVGFWSPRNSEMVARIPYTDALDLAKIINSTLRI